MALGTPGSATSAQQSEGSSKRAAEAPTADSFEGERKIVTALFADLKGSTELMEALDPEEAHEIVAPLLRIMTETVQRYEGYVARTTGDGIFALFGAPTAFEDHPQRALYAALEMQQKLRAHREQGVGQGRRGLEARVGVHTGEVVAYAAAIGGKVEYRLIGHTANLASRLEALAPVGSIATSEYTRQLCEGYFELRALGPTTVKGLGAPIEVYEVTGRGPLRTHFELAARRGLTRFIGRERELEHMRRALDLVIDGHGQIVAVVADAGTGKSRLFHEFRAAIPSTCKVFQAYSVSHGKASPWLPVLELLRGYFGIANSDDAAARRAKVRNALTALDPALADALPYLFGLLGVVEGPDPLAQMDPQIKRRRTLDAIKRIILHESLEQPVVVIFEDLHWIDAQTQALLDVLADGLARAGVLLLVSYRPEYRHEWTNKSYYGQLRLDPLSGADGAAMLTALVGGSIELEPVKRLIAERTGGNPFFIEEIVQALFDEGALVRNGVVKATRSSSQLRLPATVQGILAARIDRLAPEQKDLLQTLAVIGRESSLSLLGEVASHADAQLAHMLGNLQAGEFIYEQPAATGVEYVFKHALTQEVAYNSLLIERRKQLHERAGQALEAMFANQLDDHLSQLAHHYSHSDNADKAIEYLGRAGQQAVQRAAHADAIGSLTAALELLENIPDGPERIQRELPLQFAIGPAFIALKGWGAPEMERAFARARELCSRLGDPPEVYPALIGLTSTHMVRGQMRAAGEMAAQLLQLAEKTRDPHQLLWAHSQVGMVAFHRGDLLTGREHTQAAIALYDRERDAPHSYMGIDVGVVDLSYGAWILWHLGYPDQALKLSHEARELAEALSHPDSIAFALGYQCTLRYLRGDVEMVQALAERQIVLCTEYGLATFLEGANLYVGWAMSVQARGEEGVDRIRKAITAQRASGFGMLYPTNLATLAEACLAANHFDEGLSALTKAEAIAEDHGEYCSLAEVDRLRGELWLNQGGSGAQDSRSCFDRAVEVACNQSAKSFELRATTSLARLLAKEGHRQKARTMLVEIYGWFTEGFETADLKEAKALLDELSG
jgi:class 3 adenylate cyclase/predicted ATPase